MTTLAGTLEDVSIERCGSLYLIRARTLWARDWLTANVDDSALWWEDSLVFARAEGFPELFDSMCDAGMVIR